MGQYWTGPQIFGSLFGALTLGALAIVAFEVLRILVKKYRRKPIYTFNVGVQAQSTYNRDLLKVLMFLHTHPKTWGLAYFDPKKFKDKIDICLTF